MESELQAIELRRVLPVREDALRPPRAQKIITFKKKIEWKSGNS